jgi:hypothetical protein
VLLAAAHHHHLLELGIERSVVESRQLALVLRDRRANRIDVGYDEGERVVDLADLVGARLEVERGFLRGALGLHQRLALPLERLVAARMVLDGRRYLRRQILASCVELRRAAEGDAVLVALVAGLDLDLGELGGDLLTALGHALRVLRQLENGKLGCVMPLLQFVDGGAQRVERHPALRVIGFGVGERCAAGRQALVTGGGVER